MCQLLFAVLDTQKILAYLAYLVIMSCESLFCLANLVLLNMLPICLNYNARGSFSRTGSTKETILLVSKRHQKKCIVT